MQYPDSYAEGVRVGYHASHEQFTPSALLAYVKQAESAGFHAAMCSDHFAPFLPEQGESGAAWSWLGAALASTTLSLGTVNAPGQRYNPALIAQSIATLSEMFAGRFWVALGSGQLINEHITGDRWPTKDERNARLLECVRVIRALLAGETVTAGGQVRLSEAKLYTLPKTLPRIFAAAITPQTAAWAASWADGLITVFQPGEKLRETVSAFRDAGGGDRPVYLQVQHAFAPTAQEAIDGAFREWRQCVLPSSITTDLRMPGQIADATKLAQADEVAVRIRISHEPAQHLEWLREYEALGIDTVFVHNVTRHQQAYIDAFGEHVLPHFGP